MSKRKGVSAEEKKTRMLQLFYEKKSFFQLKELEKIAPKEKGIISNSVKDVIQSLVDDGLVDTDKIGTSIYFWAFSSKASHARKRKIEEVGKKIDEYSKKLKYNTEEVQKLKLGREESSERNQLLDSLLDLQIERDQLEKELKKYEDNDPEVLERMRLQTTSIKDAANRWTDNIFNVKTWCRNKFNMESEVLNKQFGIPEDFDYIE